MDKVNTNKPKVNLTKLDENYKKFKNDLLKAVNKECNNPQRYIDSFKDSYTGWEPGINSNTDYLIKQYNKD